MKTTPTSPHTYCRTCYIQKFPAWLNISSDHSLSYNLRFT